MAGRRGRLVVVGDGADRERLMGLAPPNVDLRGRVADDELDRLYAACDAVIHPAIDDFGIVPVEALAAGRPVVAFAEGGAPDSIREVAMQRMRSCARPLATMRPRARAVRGGVNSEARSPQLRICPAHVLKSYSRPISRSPCIGVRGGVFLRKRVSTIGSRRS